MLAIVIPYYKKTFFRETMESIASQTCKDFVLYIGDDASPENPQDIIDEYKDMITIVYHRFEENLGGKDLVAQWERCIALTKGEDWLWLFSDDDWMENSCVNEFYSMQKEHPDIRIMRYVKKFCNIVEGGSFCATQEKGIVQFSEFVWDGLGLTKNHITMPEFLFHRSLHEKYGIVNVPLAWGSDKITYLQYVLETGQIMNLSSTVYYRLSDKNISSGKDLSQNEAKYKGRLAAIKWHKPFFKHLRARYKNINADVLEKLYVDRQCYFLSIDNLTFIKRLKVGFVLFIVAPTFENSKVIVKSIMRM